MHGCPETAPPQAKLTFSEPIQPSFAALTVTRPDGQRWERSEPKVNNRDVCRSRRPRSCGAFTVAFRVIRRRG
ncbi:copper resistance CopC family protein [Nocardia sp. NPDC003726]